MISLQCVIQIRTGYVFGNLQVRRGVRLKRLIIQAFWFETTTPRFLNNFGET